jgi:hypothetical protein
MSPLIGGKKKQTDMGGVVLSVPIVFALSTGNSGKPGTVFGIIEVFDHIGFPVCSYVREPTANYLESHHQDREPQFIFRCWRELIPNRRSGNLPSWRQGQNGASAEITK